MYGTSELHLIEMVIQTKVSTKHTASSTFTEPYNWKQVSGRSQSTNPVAPAKIFLR